MTDETTAPLPPDDELSFRFSKSGGPGGQHVNKSNTKVEAVWDIDSSESITDEQRATIREELHTRIDNEGNLHVASSSERSQYKNRGNAVDKLRRMVAEALTPEKERVDTTPTKQAREGRLKYKREKSRKKELRKPVDWSD